MKVLYVIDDLSSGGAEKLISDLLPLLKNRYGVETDLLLLTDKGNVYQEKIESYGINVDVIKLRKLYSPININYIGEYISNGNYDIVHVHLFPASYWVALSRVLFHGRSRTKYVFTEHSCNNRRRNKAYFRIIDRYVYSKYDLIISIIESARDNLVRWLKVKGPELDKFIIINNGVDISRYSDAPALDKKEICPDFSQDTKLICMVSRFIDAKDQPTLIRAMKSLPDNVNLLLVGEGPLIGQSREIAAELGVSERVHFLGFRSDVDRLLKASDIIVLSSKWEGLSLSSVEGMASGRPFVASRVQGLEDIAGGFGLLFKQGDHTELSDIILELLDDGDMYQVVSKECLKRAKMFDIDKTAEFTFAAYKKIVS